MADTIRLSGFPASGAPIVQTKQYDSSGKLVSITETDGNRTLVQPMPSEGSSLARAAARIADAHGDLLALGLGPLTFNGGLTPEQVASVQALVSGGGIQARSLGATTFYSFGDSITADGGRIINASAVADPNVYQYSWQKFAQLTGGDGAFYWGGTFGLGGQTINQLRTIYLPYLLNFASSGDVVTVLMGQNDLGGITAQTFLDYRFCIESMIAAGLIPVLGTLTPGTNTRTWHALNTFVLSLASEKKLAVIDFHAATVDPATGLWQAALTRDGGIHPNQAGAKAMGLAAGTTLATLAGRRNALKWLAQHSVDFGPDRTTQTGGNLNPLFATDDGAVPPIPTGWAIPTGSHSSAIAFSSASVGRKMTLTQPAGGAELIVRCYAGTVIPGDVCLLAFWLTSAVKATGGYCRFGVFGGAGEVLSDFGRVNDQGGSEDVSRSLVLIPFVHSGATGVLIDISIGLGTGGATAVVEQFTLLNLTAMGVV